MEVRELLDKVAENLSVRRVFGEAYERDGLLIIPVALVVGGGGGGEGPIKPPAATRPPAVEKESGGPPESPPPTNTGGGFGGVVRPVGVYVVKGDQVQWVPAFDATLMVLAGLGVLRGLMALSKNRRRLSRG